MATSVAKSSAVPHSPPGPNAPRPKGILKNSISHSPPLSPTGGLRPHLPHSESSTKNLTPKEAKELTIANTHYNAGDRRSSSVGTCPMFSRRQSRAASYAGDEAAVDELELGQRLKWDEANLYLAEQERTATMKITEPKTPFARNYDPAEDPSDDDDDQYPKDVDIDAVRARLDGLRKRTGSIPDLELGEPTENVPSRSRSVHVDGSSLDGRSHMTDEEDTGGMTPEEREKHLKFEAMRRKHYEMKNVAQLLGHPERLASLDADDEYDDEDDNDDSEEDEKEDGDKTVPPVPPLPNGSS